MWLEGRLGAGSATDRHYVTQPERPIAEVLPDLVQTVVSALVAAGRPELAEQLTKVSLRSASYDDSVDAGYLYVTQSRPLNIGEQNTIRVCHGECVTLDSPGTVLIDVDNVGRLMGIELLGYSAVFKRLGVAGCQGGVLSPLPAFEKQG